MDRVPGEEGSGLQADQPVNYDPRGLPSGSTTDQVDEVIVSGGGESSVSHALPAGDGSTLSLGGSGIQRYERHI